MFFLKLPFQILPGITSTLPSETSPFACPPVVSQIHFNDAREDLGDKSWEGRASILEQTVK